MKKILGLTACLLAGFTSSYASATLLDFNDQSNLGVTLGGGMTWRATGGGHLYNETYNNDDYINFSSATYVNSFEMNAMPWQGYTGGNIGSIDIAGLDSNNDTVWSATVDLTSYTDWNNWFVVSVDTADIMQLAFTAPGSAPHNNGFWPSVDNLVINEQSSNVPSNVPEPASLALLGLGLAGLGFSRRKKSA